ncbi:unnamed protein product [marine sediment metagenome]|uniref:USP domain-containing protein n=1 Tax=marine sediment metagenome TaxID=412755 RepID=X0YWL1_9ZZZZ
MKKKRVFDLVNCPADRPILCDAADETVLYPLWCVAEEEDCYNEPFNASPSDLIMKQFNRRHKYDQKDVYAWADNSCWLDSSMVSLFAYGNSPLENRLRAVVGENRLPPHEQAALVELVRAIDIMREEGIRGDQYCARLKQSLLLLGLGPTEKRGKDDPNNFIYELSGLLDYKPNQHVSRRVVKSSETEPEKKKPRIRVRKVSTLMRDIILRDPGSALSLQRVVGDSETRGEQLIFYISRSERVDRTVVNAPEYLETPVTREIYRLVSFMVFLRDMSHWIAYVWNSQDDTWYRYNDIETAANRFVQVDDEEADRMRALASVYVYFKVQ